jgi:NADPH:quinone reductase-like Zn-dependent oxidoreductase
MLLSKQKTAILVLLMAGLMGTGTGVFLYGALSPEPTPLPLFDVLGMWITIRGYVMMEITSDLARLERAKKFVNDGLANGTFKPLVAKTFPLDKIVDAHRFLESNQQIGKIVVTV